MRTLFKKTTALWLLLAVLVSLFPPFPSWVNKAEASNYGIGYDYRRTITVDPSKVSGASNLSNFPVLVSLTDTTFKTTGNGGHVSDTQGDDIIFTSDAAGDTKLSYEREYYSPTTGEFTAWVKVPTLDTTSNTVIYMFYGSTTVTASKEDIVNTWDSNYKEVLHLAETSGQHLDSTSNNNDSTSVSVTAQGTAWGKFSRTDTFNGTSDVVTIPDAASLDIANTGTIEAWVTTTSTSSQPIANMSAWKTRTDPGYYNAAEYGQLDSVIVGERIYYGNVNCATAADSFKVASGTLDQVTITAWATSTSPSGACASTGGSSIGVDSDGQYIWYAVLNNAGASGTFSFATSTLAGAMSAWQNPANPTWGGANAAEASSVDVVITGGKAYFYVIMLSTNAETDAVASVNLDGSNWSGWVDPSGTIPAGTTNEGCGTGLDTNGDRLYIAGMCANTTTYGRMNMSLGLADVIAWTADATPTTCGTSEHCFNDISIVGDYMYHAAFTYALAVESYSYASSTLAQTTPALAWINLGTGQPDGAANTNSADASLESDGKNLYYSALVHNGSVGVWTTASSSLPAHPFVSKLQAYEMIQTGSGYVFDWDGKPTTFGTTTRPNIARHVVVSQNGSIMNYYVDGTLVGSTTVSTDFQSNANNLLLGKGFRSDGSAIFFGGTVDEVRISDTARSYDWIATQYNNQNATSTFYTLGVESTNVAYTPAQIYSASNQRFRIGQASTFMSPITIVASSTSAITAAQNIRIAIATTSGFKMEWDTSITTATIGGGAIGKVSTTVSYATSSELIIDVTSDFADTDSIVISGLKYKNFIAPAKSGTGVFLLYPGGAATGTPAATSPDIVTITTGAAIRINKPPNYLTLGAGLVAYWTFDGKNMYNNIADSSGQGNSARLAKNFTATTTAQVPGKIGQALAFDGVKDYASSTSNSAYNFGSSDFTVAWWEYRTSFANEKSTIVRDDTNIYPPFIFGYSIGTTAIYTCMTSNGSSWNIPSGCAIVGTTVLNTWQHYAIRRSGSGFYAYQNGVMTAMWSSALALNTSASDFLFGKYKSSGEFYYSGVLDEVRIYNQALSTSSIQLLYRAGQTKVSTATTPPNLQSGLIGYWTFNGPDMFSNIPDKTGTGNTGYLIGQAATTTAPGKIGQALLFDGVDDYVDVTDNNSLETTNGSVSAWMKSTSDADMNIFGASVGNSGFVYSIEVGPSTGSCTNEILALFIEGGTVMCYITTNRRELFDGQWHHIAITNQGTTKFYIDGVSKTVTVGFGSDTGTFIGATTNKIRIGDMRTGDLEKNFFNGSIDDVRVYNRALSAAEVLQLYRLGGTKVKP